MPTPIQVMRAAYIPPPAPTIVQPNLGPDVGPVPLFSAPKKSGKPIHKHPLFIPLLFLAVLYFFSR